MAKHEIVNLLIVEDSEQERLLLIELLRGLARKSRLGFRVKLTSNGKKGLKYAMEWNPDIILLDIHLPDINGMQVIKQLESNQMLESNLILLTTGDTSEETAIAGLSSGANDIIFKPIKSVELALKIANLLEIRQNKKRLNELNMKLENEQKVLSKFFTSDLMEHIQKERGNAELSGIQTFATVVSFHIHNLSEMTDLKAESFAALLSDVYNGISSIVYAGYGSVNRFLSDGILATFGTPVVYANDAYNAILVAEGMIAFMDEFNHNLPEESYKHFSYTIGISSGGVFAGNIGSKFRMEYLVIGAAVDQARMLSKTDIAGTHLLIDEMTKDVLSDVITVVPEGSGYKITSVDTAKAEELYINTKQVTYDNLSDIGNIEFF